MRKRINSFADARNPFAQRLEVALKHDKITQVEFAKKINVSTVTVSRYITGREKPSLDNLMKIQRVLDVSLDWLCGLVD